jgi:hypothetical protein
MRVFVVTAAALLLAGCTGEPQSIDDQEDDDQGQSGVLAARVCATGAPYTTISAAVAAAAPGATIQVCPGTYRERVVIAKSLQLEGAGAATTIIDGQRLGTTVAVRGGVKVAISGFTITGGKSTGAGGGLRCDASVLSLRTSVLASNLALGGGGLYAAGCTVDLQGATFKQNQAGLGHGGGAFLDHSRGTVRACRFDGNQGEHGGGLTVSEGNVAVLDSELLANHAGAQGGGLWLASDGEVARNQVHDNVSGWIGGGLFLFQHAPLVHDNAVRKNHSGNDGGGFYLHQSKATVRTNLISENQADDDAGGLRLFESAALVERNRIENNVSMDGGGGIKVSHVPASFSGNVIRGNRSGTGGGVMMDNDASTFTGDEVSENSASGGGGFYIDLAPWTGAHLKNVLIARNQAWIGGGVMMTGNFQPIELAGVRILDNVATNVGGGILARGSDYRLAHTLIARNQALSGGGIYHGVADPYTDPCPCPMTTTVGRVQFSVLVGNRATGGAGSAIFGETAGLTVESSILYAHLGMAVQVSAAPAWRYNDVLPASFSGMLNPTGVNGNLAVEPRFLDAGHDNFHLAAGSACIDAGDVLLRDADGTRADMGMFGGP